MARVDEVLDELRVTLLDVVGRRWVEAAAAGDSDEVQRLAGQVHNPDIVRALGRAGWVAPEWPLEHGGRGLDAPAAQAVRDRLDDWSVPRVPRGSGLPLAAPTILAWADEATKRRLLPPLASGEERWCQLFSEPGAGSDLASLATTAVRDGDEWVVTGQKVWTTHAQKSEMAMLLARTGPEQPKHKGITYFGLDMRAPGVTVRPLVQMTGEVEFNEVFLDEVRVPDLLRIGPVGQGWGAALTTLAAERHTLSGVRRKRKASDEILGGKTVEEVWDLARRRGRWDDPVIRQRLAAEHTANRLLGLNAQRNRARAAAGRSTGAEGSMTKVAKAAANQSLQLLAVELLGSAGVSWAADDAEVPGYVRELLRTRANSIEGGTSEVQRNIVGERLLGLPREPDPWKGRPWREVPR